MKKTQRSSFKLNPIAAAIAIAMTSQFGASAVYAGSGFGSGMDTTGLPVSIPTYYANSPAGPVPEINLITGATIINPKTGLPLMVDSGKALRKFVDTLPGIGAAKANNLGQYIPVAVPEKWVDLNGVATTDDYYEIAAVEYSEKLHSDLPKATRLRGYVQLSTAKNPGLHIPLTYPNGTPILDPTGVQVYAYDNPHHLGPIINATKGTAVRVKFTNYLPVGGELFIPVDTSITGAGVGPDGVNKYTQNRAEIHLIGGNAPWISAGNPHQWVAPAGEVAAYMAGLGKGVSVNNVPDMPDPGDGSTTLFFPNDVSARFTFYQDRTSGLTRLNSYAGLEAGYFVTDAVEQGLIANGTIPADQIPLIIEDKTFVPSNIAQQDAKWDTMFWGQPGDLWYPHVYEPNQDPNSINGSNPVGRWDFGPLFWPIFSPTQPLPSGVHGDASFTPEAFFDTPLVNGTAYPTLTVDPKAYRFRILNASNDRNLNLSLFKADTTKLAPQLDKNGNPIVDATGTQQYFTNTEVKMIPAMPDAAGNPPGWDAVNKVQTPLPQYPNLKVNNTVDTSGPSRAWPIDARPGGTPDPATTGPDFIAIGNDGGLLPHPVDVPAQPVTYEANRRSITIGNVYCYGLYMGPAERADAIVDFSAYAGQTLILYNDAPAPNPWSDVRNDYYTGAPDHTDTGGAYSTLPGYGPNTRTIMQIKVNAAAPGTVPVPYNTAALAAALPAAYGASQPAPIVPATAYNAAFGTNNADVVGHVATGSLAQPTLDFTSGAGGAVTLTGLKLVVSGGAATGSGSGYDPLNPPMVVFHNIVNGVSCLSPGGVSASATAVVDPVTRQVSSILNFNGGSGYTCAPTVSFVSPTTLTGVTMTNGGVGYAIAPSVTFTGGGGTGAAATATIDAAGAVTGVTLTSAGTGYTTVPSIAFAPVSALTGVTVANGGVGYATAPAVTFTGGGGTGAAAIATIDAAGTVTGVTLTNPGAGYTTAPTIAFTPVTALTGVTVANGGVGYATAPAVTISGNGTGATATATINAAGTVTGVTLTSAGTGYTTAPTVAFSPVVALTGVTVANGGVGYAIAPSVTFTGGGGTGAAATATIDAAGAVTGVTLTSAGTGYTSAPTAAFSPVVALTGVTMANGGVGYATAPDVTFTGGGGTGAAAIATINAAGTVTGVTLTNPGAGYTTAPTIAFTPVTALSSAVSIFAVGSGYAVGDVLTFTNAPGDVGTGAAGVVASVDGSGAILAVTLTSRGTGYTLAPSVGVTSIAGTGAQLIAAIIDGTATATVAAVDATATATVAAVDATAQGTVATADGTAGGIVTTVDGTAQGVLKASAGVGVGAQATILSSNLISLPVLTKAEQELFDASGRYNFTGGVELPMTNNLIQTTVPLSYYDSPTDFIGDNEVQVWKIVDNGFWTNSMHFDFVEVQVVNRVGWDGTVKPASANELGWKDTVRLNQLEDLIIAMRAKRPSIPFGLPKSSRLQDPSRLAGDPASGLPFMLDPNVVDQAGKQLLTTRVNAAADYDNEFVWNSANLSHAEDDLTRPLVYHPTVVVPAAPTNLADVNGTGTLTWTDPTPAGAATTIANPQNEMGFKVLKASVDAIGNVGAYTKVATVPPNVTSWTTVPLPNVAYEVVAYNAAGDSSPSVPFVSALATAPSALTANPVSYNSVTLNWASALGAANLQVWRDGVLIATLPGNATGFVDNAASAALYAYAPVVSALMTYNYQIKAVNAAGATATPVLSVTTPMQFVASPNALTATPNAAGTQVVLNWVDAANNETAYWVEVSVNGGAFAAPVVINRTAAQTSATAGAVAYTAVTAPGNLYSFRVTAVNVTGTATSTSAPSTVMVNLSPIAPAAPSNLVATLVSSTRVTLAWLDNSNNETSELITITDNTTGAVTMATITRTAAQGLATGGTVSYNATVVKGHNYSFTVAAQSSKYGLTANSNVVGPVTVSVTAPAAPTSVAAVAGAAGSGAITLNWVDAPLNAKNYTVQRARVRGGVVGTWASVATVLPGVQNFVNTGLAIGSTYVYQIRANGVVGNSAYVVSNQVVAK